MLGGFRNWTKIAELNQSISGRSVSRHSFARLPHDFLFKHVKQFTSMSSGYQCYDAMYSLIRGLGKTQINKRGFENCIRRSILIRRAFYSIRCINQGLDDLKPARAFSIVPPNLIASTSRSWRKKPPRDLSLNTRLTRPRLSFNSLLDSLSDFVATINRGLALCSSHS